MSDAYNDGKVPHGGFSVDLKRGVGAGTAVATYWMEGFTPSRPGSKIVRPLPSGGPNGFALVAGQETGSGVMQIDEGDETPKIGDWFDYTFDRKTGASAEKWVITDVSDPWQMGDYAKVNISALLSHNHPAT